MWVYPVQRKKKQEQSLDNYHNINVTSTSMYDEDCNAKQLYWNEVLAEGAKTDLKGFQQCRI